MRDVFSTWRRTRLCGVFNLVSDSISKIGRPWLRPRPILLLILSIGSVFAHTDPPKVTDRAAAVKAAKDLYQQRNFQGAIDVLNDVIRQNPDDAEAEQIVA